MSVRETVRIALEQWADDMGFDPNTSKWMVEAFRKEVLLEAADDLDASDSLRDYTDDHMGDIHAATDELRQRADGVRHLGSRMNAEDCPACFEEARNLPYPFLCPAEPGERQQAEAYQKALDTPPSEEACTYIQERLDGRRD